MRRAGRRRAKVLGGVVGAGLLLGAVLWVRGSREMQKVLDEFERRGYGE